MCLIGLKEAEAHITHLAKISVIYSHAEYMRSYCTKGTI